MAHKLRPRLCHAVSAIWALDPFTEETGGAIVSPGSHNWPDGKQPSASDPQFAATMPAGSAILFHGDLWHGDLWHGDLWRAGGANRSGRPRMGLTPQYCGQWLRTMENMPLAAPPAVARTLSPRILSLLGYNIRPSFMGYADGMHPKRVFERDQVLGVRF